MQKNKIADINTSNRQFVLRFAQEKYDETDCQLAERFTSVELQLRNIQKVCGLSNSLNVNAVEKIKDQIQCLVGLCNQLKSKATGVLLKKQIKLEQESQYRDIIKQYEARIYEMDFNVYSKQVDITVDHIGKLNSEKPYFSKVNQFNSIKTQIFNVECYMNKIGQYRDEISAFQHEKVSISCDSFPVSPKQSIKSQIKALQQIAQSNKQEKSAAKQSSTQSTQSSNPQLERKAVRNKKMLIIGSEQQMYNNKQMLFADPQMIKVWELLSLEKEREASLKKQYDRMMNVLKRTCEQNKNLTVRYQKFIGKQIQNQQIQICQTYNYNEDMDSQN